MVKFPDLVRCTGSADCQTLVEEVKFCIEHRLKGGQQQGKQQQRREQSPPARRGKGGKNSGFFCEPENRAIFSAAEPPRPGGSDVGASAPADASRRADSDTRRRVRAHP
jgi:hypothetical protein